MKNQGGFLSIILTIVVAMVLMSGGAYVWYKYDKGGDIITKIKIPRINTDKQDDWEFSNSSAGGGTKSIRTGGGSPSYSSWGMDRVSAPSVAQENIGFSVGGAKDTNNFRENIKNDYLPIPTDITYEGLFYDYYFDTGNQEECNELFCPSYSFAISEDPISQETDHYLSVGLNSGIKESDFARKKLNLVVVLDISGSGITF